MRIRTYRSNFSYLLCFTYFYLFSCVDPISLPLDSVLDVVVVDGTINNLDEPQMIRLLRSEADRVTGLPGTLELRGARVNVIVDSTRRVAFTEGKEGFYLAPADFRGQVGHTYQLEFTLSNGKLYQSKPETMPTVPPIQQLRVRFNPNSLSLPTGKVGGYTAAHDFFVDWKDPAQTKNFYRWQWKLWEKQDWCKSCVQGAYSIYNVIPDPIYYGLVSLGNQVVERCYYPPPPPPGYPPINYFIFDYRCRTDCWEILHSYDLNIFADTYTNGSLNTGRRVAQIPFNDRAPCLVSIRQSASTEGAYTYFKTLADQSERTGGLGDTPPVALVGNVRNLSDVRENVVGYFTASAISEIRYWLDRKDAEGVPPGLFMALNGREIGLEPPRPDPVNFYIQFPASDRRPPSAPCVESDTRTQTKPEGWRN